MNRREFLKATSVGLAALSLPACRTSATAAGESPMAGKPVAANRPNIIMILGDDVALGNLGCTGGPFKTPHIDALAKDGLRFSQCYAMPQCSPTRCVALTGRYVHPGDETIRQALERARQQKAERTATEHTGWGTKNRHSRRAQQRQW